MSIQAGKLNKRIELQMVTNGRDPTGGTTETWTKVTDRWAGIRPLRGQERFEAAQIEAQTAFILKIRFHPQIDATWRVKFGVRIFNITAIINVGERNEYQEIYCKEVLT